MDTYNAAQALREGKAAPTPKANPKKLEEATRNVEVAREALAQEKAEFVAMVERDRDALAATLAQRVDRAQADALRILDVVETCLRHKADQQAVLDWLANPSGRVGTRRTPGASMGTITQECRPVRAASASVTPITIRKLH